jgi:single stranded DNA-binding protein
VNFSLAFRSTKKEKTNWIKVAAFNNNAEVAAKYLHKGARIGITGLLDMDQWETEEGQKRNAIKLIAQSIEFIKTDGRGFEDNEIRMRIFHFNRKGELIMDNQRQVHNRSWMNGLSSNQRAVISCFIPAYWIWHIRKA